MKIIGLLILALELIALALQLKNECQRSNVVPKTKETFNHVKDKFKFKPKTKPKSKTNFGNFFKKEVKKPSKWKWRSGK